MVRVSVGVRDQQHHVTSTAQGETKGARSAHSKEAETALLRGVHREHHIRLYGPHGADYLSDFFQGTIQVNHLSGQDLV